MHSDLKLEDRDEVRIILPSDTTIDELERLTTRFANDEHFHEGYYLEMLSNGLPMVVVRAEPDLSVRLIDALRMEFPPHFFFRDVRLALCAEGPGALPLHIREEFVDGVIRKIEKEKKIRLPLQITVVLSPQTYH